MLYIVASIRPAHNKQRIDAMTYTGRCHCGAIRYQLAGEPKDVALCHCTDCQRSSGAPMIAWAGYSENALTVSHGTPKTINSSGAAMRSFCADCGTGLFYRHAEILPDVVEVQLATLDDPNALTPTAHIQTAERIGWMKDTHNLPTFDRFPE
jgi:hypothetical protein